MKKFAVGLLALTLAACSSQPEKASPAPAKPKRPSAEQAIAAPLPGHLRQLSGSLLGIPADAEAEIALRIGRDVSAEQAAALDEAGALALVDGVAAAEQGVAYTKTIIATKGRASYLGERSLGHQDPGATSFTTMLKVAAAHV